MMMMAASQQEEIRTPPPQPGPVFRQKNHAIDVNCATDLLVRSLKAQFVFDSKV
jgi:hypothetical protein